MTYRTPITARTAREFYANLEEPDRTSPRALWAIALIIVGTVIAGKLMSMAWGW